MIFSKKEKKVTAYTVEKCPNCKKESKREFKDGDFLFAQSTECTSCKVPAIIVKIFGETIA
jgi:ssDNA-binding Zn-finger/Zn-ribbon topoisomerase 1